MPDHRKFADHIRIKFHCVLSLNQQRVMTKNVEMTKKIYISWLRNKVIKPEFWLRNEVIKLEFFQKLSHRNFKNVNVISFTIFVQYR